MKLIAASSFTIRNLQQIGFPIKGDLGQAKITNKADSGWQAGAPSLVRIAKNEVDYHKMFPGHSVQLTGSMLDVPVYADEDLDFGLLRLVEGDSHWEGYAEDIDHVLKKLQDFLR